MLDSLYQKLRNKATTTMIIFVLVGCLLCILGFTWRNNTLAVGLPAGEKPSLDGRFWYNSEEVEKLFAKLKENNNLQLYATSEITLDLIFPLLYTSLFVFLMIRVFPAKSAKYVILLPILTGICDLLENFTIAFLAFTFQSNAQLSGLASLAPIFTSSKWIFSTISGVILVVGWIWSLLRRRGSQTEEEV